MSGLNSWRLVELGVVCGVALTCINNGFFPFVWNLFSMELCSRAGTKHDPFTPGVISPHSPLCPKSSLCSHACFPCCVTFFRLLEDAEMPATRQRRTRLTLIRVTPLLPTPQHSTYSISHGQRVQIN